MTTACDTLPLTRASHPPQIKFAWTAQPRPSPSHCFPTLHGGGETWRGFSLLGCSALHDARGHEVARSLPRCHARSSLSTSPPSPRPHPRGPIQDSGICPVGGILAPPDFHSSNITPSTRPSFTWAPDRLPSAAHLPPCPGPFTTTKLMVASQHVKRRMTSRPCSFDVRRPFSFRSHEALVSPGPRGPSLSETTDHAAGPAGPPRSSLPPPQPHSHFSA